MHQPVDTWAPFSGISSGSGIQRAIAPAVNEQRFEHFRGVANEDLLFSVLKIKK